MAQGHVSKELFMTTVGPQTQTIVPVIYDFDDRGFAGIGDMNGPPVGTLRYRQDTVGNIELEIDIEFGHPNRTYDVVLTAGPSHDLAAGWVVVGQLVTGPDGRGFVALVVPAGVLLAPPFGPGARADHIDILEIASLLTAGVLTAGAVNYFVCRRRGVPPGEEIPETRPELRTGDGDPLDLYARE
jgi:hypothetical protein